MFRAYDPEHEHLVAIKLFKLDLPPERVHQLVAAFERLIAADLTHPVLAAPLATGIADVTAYLVQDYISAESLDLVVREYGPAPPADALRVAAQLAGALDFAAEVNIFHGALHPRDVLLSSGDTRLTGLGVARALEQVGVTAPVRRPYTAPERMAGASWDRRADVFSLATLVHELLWARRVSGFGADAVKGLSPIEGGDARAVRAVFSRALAENPDERFATALEFAEALKIAFPDVVPSGERPVETPPAKPVRVEHEPRLPLYHDDDHASVEAPIKDLPLAPAAPPPPVAVHDEFKPKAPRFDDVEVAATTGPRVVSIEEAPAAGPAGLITGHDPESMSALERTRSAVWPLVLALSVGLAIGFAGGYGVGSHDRTPASAAPTVGAAPAGREFTEIPVTEPAKPAAPAPADAITSRPLERSEPPKPTPTPAPPPPAPTAAAPAAPDGRLLIRSMPAGAQVSVDGKDVGRTPATVRDLPRGPHRVSVSRDGYVAQERRVVISSSRPSQSVNVTLVRVAPPAPPARTASAVPTPARAVGTGGFVGVLEVDSRPTGARVYLDGKLMGNTPLSMPTVPAGEHAVRLEHDGYRRWSSSVRVVASERNRVTASLER